MEQFDTSGDRPLNFQEFSVSLMRCGRYGNYITDQEILVSLHDCGWDIRNQEANEDFGAGDLKEMFIEADKERRNSSGLVVPRRVKANK